MNVASEMIEKRAFIALCRDKSLSVSVRKDVARVLCEYGLSSAHGRRIMSFISPNGLKSADVELSKAKENGVSVFSLIDGDYPYALSQIDDAPFAIFVRGKLSHGCKLKSGAECCNAHDVAYDNVAKRNSDRAFLSIAIVGSRKSTQRARCFAEELSFELTKMGVIIVSGLAYGIDTAAHRGAIMAAEQFVHQDEVTGEMHSISAGVAVLGSGVLNVYPDENKQLSESLIQNDGALISEYGLYANPLKGYFPARNRIISGLCRATIVIEAGEKSGACITARTALEQGREVFAVPGSPWNESSRGTNKLIKQGATLIESADDVLNMFSDYVAIKSVAKQATTKAQSDFITTDSAKDLENQLLTILRGVKDVHIDELALLLRVMPHELMHVLTCLEIGGSIYRHPGERYSVHRFVDK